MSKLENKLGITVLPDIIYIRNSVDAFQYKMFNILRINLSSLKLYQLMIISL